MEVIRNANELPFEYDLEEVCIGNTGILYLEKDKTKERVFFFKLSISKDGSISTKHLETLRDRAKTLDLISNGKRN